MRRVLDEPEQDDGFSLHRFSFEQNARLFVLLVGGGWDAE